MWTTCTKTENFSLELQAEEKGARNVKYSRRNFDWIYITVNIFVLFLILEEEHS